MIITRLVSKLACRVFILTIALQFFFYVYIINGFHSLPLRTNMKGALTTKPAGRGRRLRSNHDGQIMTGE